MSEPQENGEQSDTTNQHSSSTVDEEHEDVKHKIEEEEKKHAATQSLSSTTTNKQDSDSRSVYVGQVDYSASVEDLHNLFSACGPVRRVTILVNKTTGHSKGCAYIEFGDLDSVSNAFQLNDTEYKGRQLQVTPKRTNLPRSAIQTQRRIRGVIRGQRGYIASKNQKVVNVHY